MHLLDDGFRLALLQTWQITLIIPVAIFLVRLLFRRSSHLAYAVLLLVLLKCLLPPVWESRLGVLGRLNGWVTSESLSVSANDAPQSVFAVEPEGVKDDRRKDDSPRMRPLAQRTEQVGPPERSQNRSHDSSDVEIKEEPVPAPSVIPEIKSAPALKTTGANWPRLLTGIWITGCAAMLVWLAVCLVRLRRLRAKAMTGSADLTTAAQRVARRIGLVRLPDVLVTDETTMPLAFGLIRPAVLLPRHIVRSTQPDELDLILTHEFNHVRRGDRWTGLLQILTQVLWWFHPCVWWLNREIRRYREHCCDEEVLAHVDCPPRQYAQCLLSVLELNERCSPLLGLAGMSPFEVTSQRMRNIMRTGGWFRRQTPAWCWLVLLGLGSIILPGASLSDPTDTLRVQIADTASEFPLEEKATAPVPEREHTQDAPPAVPRTPASNYQWTSGSQYAYRMKIEVDHGDELETFSGSPTFSVSSVHGTTAELIVTGHRLQSVRHPKPGRLPRFDLAPAAGAPPVDFPPPRYFGELTVRIDETGNIISSSGELESLPYLLGTVCEIVFPALTGSDESTWRESETTTVQITREKSPYDGRFRNPFSTSGPETLRAESTREFERSSYNADEVVLFGSLSTATITAVAGEPRIELAGQSRWTFDEPDAPPVLIESDVRLIVREENSAITWPISLTAERMPDQIPETAASGEKSPPSYHGPHPVPSTERTVTAETPLLLDQIVQVNWNGAWYPAKVKRLEPTGAVHVHYRGWSDRWDEVVGRSRIQLADRNALDVDD
ncbi:MAG: hypothetical protein DWQ34_09635 [Planctomycetota bacterium]|nr:MAG: hypothetical protein DWQ29_07130 [Planctomycetota bacterium]REJ93920.1 MAG: hypothetical protein DWQ34_09635 [Planctomycetota bacterium]REK20674.1 MAG: hypothetical protein DWQ41_23790 [Planctomycetota bacterium]REK38144.1 MAG: hypothetical protein DWQ45_05760 [Planctomycetota bacterium]